MIVQIIKGVPKKRYIRNFKVRREREGGVGRRREGRRDGGR
jgi:hypothetical protein